MANRKASRNVRKPASNARKARKTFSEPNFRKGSAVGKMYAALQKGATLDQLVRVSGMTEGTVRSYFPFFRNKYGVNITREGKRGESTYYAD
jgi:hypothetical protein